MNINYEVKKYYTAAYVDTDYHDEDITAYMGKLASNAFTLDALASILFVPFEANHLGLDTYLVTAGNISEVLPKINADLENGITFDIRLEILWENHNIILTSTTGSLSLWLSSLPHEMSKESFKYIINNLL